MQQVGLIVVKLDDLGGPPPALGAELVLGGVRCEVLSVMPSKRRLARRRSRRANDQPAPWKLLVQMVEPSGSA